MLRCGILWAAKLSIFGWNRNEYTWRIRISLEAISHAYLSVMFPHLIGKTEENLDSVCCLYPQWEPLE
jgi:hypothetical protein